MTRVLTMLLGIARATRSKSKAPSPCAARMGIKGTKKRISDATAAPRNFVGL
jgi:hypothetical protein